MSRGEGRRARRAAASGLVEVARTIPQAAEATDIPVSRLLDPSPSGPSEMGESDVRNDARHDRGPAGSDTLIDSGDSGDPGTTDASGRFDLP